MIKSSLFFLKCKRGSPYWKLPPEINPGDDLLSHTATGAAKKPSLCDSTIGASGV